MSEEEEDDHDYCATTTTTTTNYIRTTTHHDEHDHQDYVPRLPRLRTKTTRTTTTTTATTAQMTTTTAPTYDNGNGNDNYTVNDDVLYVRACVRTYCTYGAVLNVQPQFTLKTFCKVWKATVGSGRRDVIWFAKNGTSICKYVPQGRSGRSRHAPSPIVQPPWRRHSTEPPALRRHHQPWPQDCHSEDMGMHAARQGVQAARASGKEQAA